MSSPMYKIARTFEQRTQFYVLKTFQVKIENFYIIDIKNFGTNDLEKCYGLIYNRQRWILIMPVSTTFLDRQGSCDRCGATGRCSLGLLLQEPAHYI